MIDFVPSNSIMLVKMSQVKAPLHEFGESSFWKKFISKEEKLTDFRYNYKQILKLLSSEQLDEKVEQVFMSFILSGTYDVDVLFTLQLRQSIIKKLIHQAEQNNIAVYSSFYQTYAIYQFNLDGHIKGKSLGQVYLCEFNNILFLSPSRLLIEDGLKYSMTDLKLTDDPIFNSLYKSASISDPINVFINHKQFNKVKFLPRDNFMHFFRREKNVSWTKLDFHLAQEHDSFQAFTVLKTNTSLDPSWKHVYSTEHFPKMMKMYCDRIRVSKVDWSSTYLLDIGSQTKALSVLLSPTSVVCKKENKTWQVLEHDDYDELTDWLENSTTIVPKSKTTFYNPKRKMWYQLLDNTLWISRDTTTSQVMHQYGYQEMKTNEFAKQGAYYMDEKGYSHYAKNDGVFRYLWEALRYYTSAQVDAYRESDQSFVSKVRLNKLHEPNVNISKLYKGTDIPKVQFINQPYYHTIDVFGANKSQVFMYKSSEKKAWVSTIDHKTNINKWGYIDWYKNQKYQFWYLAGNALYLYPRDGVLHRKINFAPLRSVQFLSRIYYKDIKKYRFFATSGTKIVVKDREGRTIKGFRFKPKQAINSDIFHVNQSGTDLLITSDTSHKLYIMKRNGKVLYTHLLDSIETSPIYSYVPATHTLMVGHGNKVLLFKAKNLMVKDSVLKSQFVSEIPVVRSETKLWGVKNARIIDLVTHQRWKIPEGVNTLDYVKGTDVLILNQKFLGYSGENKELRWIEVESLERMELKSGYLDRNMLHANFIFKNRSKEQEKYGGILKIQIP